MDRTFLESLEMFYFSNYGAFLDENEKPWARHSKKLVDNLDMVS